MIHDASKAEDWLHLESNHVDTWMKVHTRYMGRVVAHLVYFPDGTRPPAQGKVVVARGSLLCEKN